MRLSSLIDFASLRVVLEAYSCVDLCALRLAARIMRCMHVGFSPGVHLVCEPCLPRSLLRISLCPVVLLLRVHVLPTVWRLPPCGRGTV